jgi:2,4-dienoyl-CoA reductase-like NADH-dependent reductase (Old Yellow Enzyme family)
MMVKRASRLFEPITLGGLTLPNRVAVSSMCQYSAEYGSATDWHLQHLGSLSVSGAGLVIVEQTAVEPAGRITHACLGLYSDANEAALAHVGALCRRCGNARLGIQLGHAGRKGSARLPWEGGGPLGLDAGAWTTVAPSAIPFGDGWPAPRELDKTELRLIRDAHAEAARRANRLGFDLVEVLAAHGFLLHSFLSPLTNRRIDGYGGGFDGRMRFPLEVDAAVRAAWPREKALGMRITGSAGSPAASRPRRPAPSPGRCARPASITYAYRPAGSPRRRARSSLPGITCRSPRRSERRPASPCRRSA